jgi:hypothetical protein
MVPAPDGAAPTALLAGAGFDAAAGWTSGTACTEGDVWGGGVDVPREANQAIETTSTTADTPAMRSMVLRERDGEGEGSAGGGADPFRERGALHW